MIKAFNLLTTKELAVELDMKVPAIQRWTRRRVIPCIKTGHRSIFYDLEAVRRALQKRTVHELTLKSSR